MPLTASELAGRGPVIPVIVIHHLEHAVPLARALVAGGLTVLEVTMRTPIALEAMRAIAQACPEALVGAGTVRTVDDVARAHDAGCRFAVSPGYLPEIGAACRSAGLPLLPGVATASEVMAARRDGHDLLKFFPAAAAGGVPMLKALAGPFPDAMFCPTGGITAQSAPEYLALPNVRVCGGSWMTPQPAIDQGDWDTITRLAREAQSLRRA